LQHDDGGAKITKTLAKDNGKCALRTSTKSCAPGGKPPEPLKGNSSRKCNSKDNIDDKCGHSRKSKKQRQPLEQREKQSPWRNTA
jgi:hypothetical protein